MNFATEQDPQESAGADEAPDFGGETDPTFVSGEKKPPANPQLLALVGLLVVGAAAVWFVYFRNGPASAAAAEPAGPDTVQMFLASGPERVQLMQQTLQNTDKVVQRFRATSASTQVPLASLRTNPFRQMLAVKAKPNPEHESEAAARRRREEERQAAFAAAQSLRVQSIVRGGKYQACMVNAKMYRLGDTVDGFVVEQINPAGVVVRNGAYRFEVPLQKR